ncbi:hypothetical protein DERP_011384 [Dermatophagoides pteronyssinus]|uniref:Uncharacterized protein n=1 Tax=Dermatophagoides pteronyssinus TaxID=6956 RepID=A0ABQ8J520_DERPT|nr:hypothetical protein DERP_011384 [Dermatophagoides pteronyssinus]
MEPYEIVRYTVPDITDENLNEILRDAEREVLENSNIVIIRANNDDNSIPELTILNKNKNN